MLSSYVYVVPVIQKRTVMNLKNPLRLALPLALLVMMNTAPDARAIATAATDSIVKLLGQTRDTVRIDLLIRISEELQSSDPTQAFSYAREALAMAEELGNTSRIGSANRAIAGVYAVTAIYDKALEYMLEAMSHFESLKDSVNIARCYNDIGVVYRLSGDFAKAHTNLQKAIDVNKKLRNHSGIAVNYMNMGLAFLDIDSIDKGLSYFTVSYMIADSLKMEKEKITLLNNIGYGFARLGKHEDALKNFYKVLELVGEQPDDLVKAEAMVNIARGYYSLKNYPAAMKYARNSYNLSKSKKFRYVYRDAARILSDIYAAQGNHKLAYNYITEFRNISDTIMNAERSEQLAKIQALYDLDLKEQENLSLRMENMQNKKQMRTRSLAIISIASLVLVLAVLLYMLNRMNNKQLALNKKLAAQSSELEALNDLKDKFFSFVAHNLKNPFNTIMGFAELMQRSTESRDAQKTRQYSSLIYDLSSQVQKVLSNLLDWSRLQRRSFEVRPETVELTSLAKDVLEMNNKEAARKDINLSINDYGSVFVTADRSMVTTVLQNLVSNAINFTPAAGQITIECHEKGQFGEVTVTDTGSGISKANLERLFHFDFSQSKIGSSDSSGAGLGLIICHEMLVKNGGNISAKSEHGKGSRFTFTLPLATRHENGSLIEEQPSERTPAEVAEKLVSSDVPASSAALADFRTVIIPRFEEVSRVLSIENLEVFAKSLITTGEKYGLVQLADYGRSLSSLTRAHQIDQIIRMLPRFREYVNGFIKHQ
jgi:signal transduction histidine kinase